MYLAAQLQSAGAGAPTWFLVSVVTGLIGIFAAVLYTYSVSQRRAQEVKDELSKRIEDVGARVTEVKADLGARITELGARITEAKTDITAQVKELKNDLTTQTSQLRADIKDAKSDIKDLMQSELKTNFVALQAEMFKALVERLPAEGKKAGSAGSAS